MTSTYPALADPDYTLLACAIVTERGVEDAVDAGLAVVVAG
ncbi:hypothetical protein ACTWPB_07000 [Nocardia sp. IBHARD005]